MHLMHAPISIPQILSLCPRITSLWTLCVKLNNEVSIFCKNDNEYMTLWQVIASSCCSYFCNSSIPTACRNSKKKEKSTSSHHHCVPCFVTVFLELLSCYCCHSRNCGEVTQREALWFWRGDGQFFKQILGFWLNKTDGFWGYCQPKSKNSFEKWIDSLN
jgi:hypothetical protein